MAALTTLQIADALKDVFKTKATISDGTVRVTLSKEMTPGQLKQLTSFCLDNNHYPTIRRSGTGMSVSFS